MIYPESFEKKIGFEDIRTLLKGRCMSSLGTEWVDNRLKFLTDHAEVVEALEQAREYVRFMQETVDVEENYFDVRQALMRIRPERTYMEELELFDLKRSLRTVIDLIQIITAREEESEECQYPALARMAEGVSTFPALVERIDGVLNKYGKVKDTASAELLSIRHNIEVTTRGISHTLRTIIIQAQTDGYIDRDVSPTLRDGRLVIPVAPALKRKIKGIVHDESATGKTVFIEPAGVVEANNRIRELKAAEKREVIRILQELSAVIRPHIHDILGSQHFLAHMDYLRALTVFSDSFGAIIPRVVAEPRIDWWQAVHPLLQQSLSRHGGSVVPLDICLRDARILLISGPNAGGKSVCLKTVGLLQYMLQCGMPIPVGERTVCGIFSDIFIDIGDEQSLENDLSTYSSHLLNMKQMMRHSTRRSLVLIDEFGGGTEPQIGGALAEAILDSFVKIGTFGVITTHYQNLKHYADSTPSVSNGAMLYDRAKMQPLFMLQVGNPGSSFAVEIARKIGIPEEVIRYATDLVGKDYVMSDKYLQDIVRDKMYWENKRKHIHQREKQLDATVERYEADIRTLQKEKKAVMTQARAEAEQLLQESNARIENTIRAIREAQAEKEQTREARRKLSEFKDSVENATSDADDPIARKMAKIMRRQERKAKGKNGAKPTGQTSQAGSTSSVVANNASAPSNAKIEVGGFVRIKGQNSVGRIAEIADRKAKVLFGVMTALVDVARLETAEKPKEEATASRVSTFVSKETRDAMYEKKLHFKPDIDLRGMRGDEALTATAYFIDDAIQLEQSRVRILHGTGTGVLRQLVRNYLRTVPGVASFRDEHVQFGGAGITVVELE
ncbi:MAG: Smr/MutS family protein [Bacteroidaceae bacterium]|nr:Smr/MutS family protein [Bacteroidaceae bacterium]